MKNPYQHCHVLTRNGQKVGMRDNLRKFQAIILAFVFLTYALLMTPKINLATADLGRHIKNGEMILQKESLQARLRVLKTNFYSYTYPDYPFINHHWGSGVIFFLLHKSFGFQGVSLFFLLVSLLTFFLFFKIAWRKSSFGVAALTAIVFLPVMASRVEVRPEVFSCLLAGLFWLILRKKDHLFLLPFLEVLWVNLHVYFFLGLFLIGVFLLEELVDLIKKGKFLGNLSHLSYLSKTLFLSTLASLANPAGLKGFLYPVKIFQNYGYRLLENQSVIFLDKIIKYPPNIFFKIAFGFLVLSWLVALVTRQKIRVPELIFSLFFSYLAWTAVRNFVLFGFFVFPVAAENWQILGKTREELRFFLLPTLSLLLGFCLFLVFPAYWVRKLDIGFGLEKGVAKASQFFLKENLSGPIFNNYDNGGYLIYYLFPQEKVFVDNRPEAYPAEFFRDVYIPMQEQEDIWKKTDQKYNFNAIFFYRHDLTPWSQTFLIKRVADSSWAPVYVDDYAIIFLKKNPENQFLIKKFELPKEIFSIKKG